jgi:metal-responsive CopG/Arc/MetJ family transcriptional regulator
MRRTTISIPDELADALEREANRRRIPVSQLAREAIEKQLGRSDEPRSLPFVGLGRSGHRHTARDLDEILASEWVDAGDR